MRSTTTRPLDVLGFLGAGAVLLGPGLAWLRVAPAMLGFGLFVLGGLTGLVVGVLAAVSALRGRGLRAGGVSALGAALLFVLAASRGAGIPAINDFTTDLRDPPAFGHAATLPANATRDLTYPPAFAAVQQACCADLRPARLGLSVENALALAQRVAERQPGWSVTSTDPASGSVEAVASTPLFGFQDDVVVRVRADPEGGSRIDVRSKSRNGRGDIGANAARIRAYVAALEASAP